jgi:hypothetical protein
MRHAIPTRRELGVPTVFNFLGPLVRALRGATALTDDAAAFLFGAPAPHAISFPQAQRVLETRLADRATEAHGLGHVGLLVGGRVEDLGIEATACSLVAPQEVHLGKVTLSSTSRYRFDATEE